MRKGIFLISDKKMVTTFEMKHPSLEPFLFYDLQIKRRF